MKNNKQGFTLIEIVISIALLSVICIGFMAVITATTGTTQRSSVYDEMSEEYVERYNKGSVEVEPAGTNNYTFVQHDPPAGADDTTWDDVVTFEIRTMDAAGNLGASLGSKEYLYGEHSYTTADGLTVRKVRDNNYNAGTLHYVSVFQSY